MQLRLAINQVGLPVTIAVRVEDTMTRPTILPALFFLDVNNSDLL